jgi:ferredoxin
MADVKFTPLGVKGQVRGEETILDVARRHGAPVGSACGGIGVCGRCRVRIVEGLDQLTHVTEVEQRVATANNFEEDERLACQAVVKGDCSVTTSYWG